MSGRNEERKKQKKKNNKNGTFATTAQFCV